MQTSKQFAYETDVTRCVHGVLRAHPNVCQDCLVEAAALECPISELQIFPLGDKKFGDAEHVVDDGVSVFETTPRHKARKARVIVSRVRGERAEEGYVDGSRVSVAEALGLGVEHYQRLTVYRARRCATFWPT
jgi:hypothetical protein